MKDKQQKLRRYLARALGSIEEGVERVFPDTGLEGLDSAREAHIDALRKLEQGKELTAHEMGGLEAIVAPKIRPTVLIQDGDYGAVPDPWTHLDKDAPRAVIKKVLPAIGRVEVPDHPSLPYAGTAFVVGEGLLMTNRHVAEIFSRGVGERGLYYDAGTAGVDFLREHQRPKRAYVKVEEVLMVHPYWDMALLRVSGLEGHAPLPLTTDQELNQRGRELVVIGYPAYDARNDAEVQNQVFGGVYYVKRMAPGKILGSEKVRSFGKDVEALTHDSSTLGGNSGSAVVDLTTGEVIGLHFAGRYLEANYAVPATELARDARVVDAGVRFRPKATATLPTPWEEWWERADRESAPSVSSSAAVLQSPGSSSSTITLTALRTGGAELTIPLRITVQLGLPEESAEAPKPSIEIDPDYSSRRGYDPAFLGHGERYVRLPWLSPDRYQEVAFRTDQKSGPNRHVLPYHHFSIVMNAERKLAFFTAVNIDGGQERSLPRPTDRWSYDPRIPRASQHGNRLYEGSPLDRGHLVRRLDPGWGSTDRVAKRAADDTYHWTNCAPQHEGFNRQSGIWAKIENAVLDYANLKNKKISVFAGPIFADDDPRLDGVPIPREYWKVVAAVLDGELVAAAFVLSQKEQLKKMDLEEGLFPDWVTYQVPIRDLEQRIDITFHDLPARDPMEGQEGTESLEAGRVIRSESDILLRRD